MHVSYITLAFQSTTYAGETTYCVSPLVDSPTCNAMVVLYAMLVGV